MRVAQTEDVKGKVQMGSRWLYMHEVLWWPEVVMLLESRPGQAATDSPSHRAFVAHIQRYNALEITSSLSLSWCH